MWLLFILVIAGGTGAKGVPPIKDFVVFQTQRGCEEAKAKLLTAIITSKPNHHVSLTCAKLEPLGRPL